jgi:DNA-binding IclR family transcriptional regulator
MVKRDKANYLIQAVSHAVDVLEELIKSGGEIGVTDLAKRLNLHKNNVFRLLATLELRGYVEQNLKTEDYRIGVKALQLGQAYSAQSDLIAKGTKVVRRLIAELQETVSLVVLRNLTVHYPLSLEPERAVRVARKVAWSSELDGSLAGRLLYALLPEAVREKVKNSTDLELPEGTLNLLERIEGGSLGEDAVKRGMPLTEKCDDDSVCFVQAIRGGPLGAVGAIEILVPSFRVNEKQILVKLNEAAKEIGESIGASFLGGSAISLPESISAPVGKTPLAKAIEKEVADNMSIYNDFRNTNKEEDTAVAVEESA